MDLEEIQNSFDYFVKIGIIGTRKRDSAEDFNKVESALVIVLDDLKKIYLKNLQVMLVSGGARSGADTFIDPLADKYRCSKVIFVPNYDRYDGKIAPLVRNNFIAHTSDILIACVARDRKGGTENCIKKFKLYHPEGKLIII